MDEQEALALLESDTVDGIYYVDETPTLTVKAEGLMQSMLRSVLDGYVQITSTVTEVAQKDPALVADAVEKLTDPAPALEEVSLSGGSMDYMRENFYSLIAMTCLYASFFGLSGAMSAQANLSPLGARRSISPTKKMALAWSDILAAVLVMFAVVLVLIAFLNALPNLDFGENLPYLLLTVLVGVFVGVMYGMLVGVAVRGSRTAKEGILIGLTLVLCFLSGLMATNMRYAVDKVAPIINSVNPAALLVDSFYTMETYGIGERFWVNIGTLAIIGALFSVLSVAILRRKQYASI
ncbi:MAG TPA: hypothetical protein DEB31_08365 [Clostridiales bacterium]|nr:hypothetical protein [Clostridiales bacterium]